MWGVMTTLSMSMRGWLGWRGSGKVQSRAAPPIHLAWRASTRSSVLMMAPAKWIHVKVCCAIQWWGITGYCTVNKLLLGPVHLCYHRRWMFLGDLGPWKSNSKLSVEQHIPMWLIIPRFGGGPSWSGSCLRFRQQGRKCCGEILSIKGRLWPFALLYSVYHQEGSSFWIVWMIKCVMGNNSHFSPGVQRHWYNGIVSFITAYPSCSQSDV